MSGKVSKRTMMAATLGTLAAAAAVIVILPRIGLRDALTLPALAKAASAEGRRSAVLEAEWFEHRWSDTRSPGAPQAPVIDWAFRFGVQSLDLAIALRTGQVEPAVILAKRQARVLEDLDRPSPAADYRRLAAQLAALRGSEPPAASKRLHGRLAETIQGERVLDEFSLTFGLWCEAGRLAGLSGNAELLTSKGFREFLAHLGERDDWHPRVAAELERLRDLLQPDLNELQLAAIAVSFQAIVARG